MGPTDDHWYALDARRTIPRIGIHSGNMGWNARVIGDLYWGDKNPIGADAGILKGLTEAWEKPQATPGGAVDTPQEP